MEIKEVEITKLNLEPGETLVLKLKGEEFLTDTGMEMAKSLKDGFQRLFPENTVAIITLPANHDVEMTKISENENKENSCNTASYCADCNCGKKEAAQKE